MCFIRPYLSLVQVKQTAPYINRPARRGSMVKTSRVQEVGKKLMLLVVGLNKQWVLCDSEVFQAVEKVPCGGGY